MHRDAGPAPTPAPSLPHVSVIVPTRGLAVRAGVIRRALASILSQSGVATTPVLVVNGRDGDSRLLAELDSDRRIRVIRRPKPGLPAALATGLAAVGTEWVAALDDDDRLLPGALARRVEVLAAEPALDVVVTGGLRSRGGVETPHPVDPEAIARDPVGAFFARNWLLPGSWLARTAAVHPWLFDGMPAHLECSFLALRFATQLRMRYLPEPTVVWHTDSPQAAHASRAYSTGRHDSLAALAALPLPADARALLADHIRSTAHDTADRALRQGDLAGALAWHLRALQSRGGWRHLPFAKHLLLAALGIRRGPPEAA